MTESSELTLEPGDWMLLDADGITERLNSKHEVFDSTRLVDASANRARDGLNAALAGRLRLERVHTVAPSCRSRY